jgi:hypothetical protein
LAAQEASERPVAYRRAVFCLRLTEPGLFDFQTRGGCGGGSGS